MIKHKSKERPTTTARPSRWIWGKRLALILLSLIVVLFGISRCQARARHSHSADAQWALNNVSLAQQAYFEAHNCYTRDYRRLAQFGFQGYDNITYSEITVYDQNPARPGWRAQVKYKSRQAVTYTYDSLGGGFLDIAQ